MLLIVVGGDGGDGGGCGVEGYFDGDVGVGVLM